MSIIAFPSCFQMQLVPCKITAVSDELSLSKGRNSSMNTSSAKVGEVSSTAICEIRGAREWMSCKVLACEG